MSIRGGGPLESGMGYLLKVVPCHFHSLVFMSLDQCRSCLVVYVAAKDLIARMLKVRPEDRISLEKAIEHPWFKVELFVPYRRILRCWI